MINIEKVNVVYNKNLSRSFFILSIIVLMIGYILANRYQENIQETLREEAKVTLGNVSAQNTANIRLNIAQKKQTMYLMANKLQEEKGVDLERILSLLRSYNDSANFLDIGIVDAQGRAYTIGGKTADLSETRIFEHGMKGISSLTSGHLSEEDDTIKIIIAVPISIQNEVQMLLIASYDPSNFTQLMDVPSFEGQGQATLIDTKAEVVAQSREANESVIELLGAHIGAHHYVDSESEIHTICDDHYFEYEIDGQAYIAYHEQLGLYDWSLVSYVPKEVAYKNLNVIKNIMSKMMLFMGTSIIALILAFLKEYVGYQRNIVGSVCTDELTKLPNYEYLKKYFKRMKAKDKKGKSLVVLDIDKFKSINILHETRVGDDLLRYIASIYQEILPGDQLCRRESDIFVGIIQGDSEEAIMRKLIKLQDRVQKDIDNQVIIPITLSFGVCALEAFEDLHSIYTNALVCKNKAKNNISQKIHFFNEAHRKELIEKRQIEAKFIEAVRNNEFEVWYQPKYNMITHELQGAEALVRWREKDGKYIFPSQFIPVFEKNGQIIALDKLVIKLTFLHIQTMHELGIAVKPISINLSRVHQEHSDITSYIRELMMAYKIDPKEVSFEITESALVENSELINKMISELHEMGFQVDIDDFGIGTSTLNALYVAEFDTLKLDKSFINNIGNLKMNCIIKSTISMAQALHMNIIAEGVETREQLQFLVEHGCTVAQGYYFSKPLKEDEYIKECLRHE